MPAGLDDVNALHRQMWHGMQSERRWACTGTPINTDLRDLRGQLGGLHAAPFSDAGFANQYFKAGLGLYQQEVLFMLRRLMIRHSKEAVQAQGECLLPPKTEELLPVRLTDAEWRLYERTHAIVRAQFAEHARRGPDWCLEHTMTIMALLTPLRRLCSGLVCAEPDAMQSEGEGESQDSSSEAGAPCCPGVDDVECSVCMEPFESPVRTPCGRWFCYECIGQVVNAQRPCPMCRTPVPAAQLQPAQYPPAPRAPAPAAGPSTAVTQLDSKVQVSGPRQLLFQLALGGVIVEPHPESRGRLQIAHSPRVAVCRF